MESFKGTGFVVLCLCAIICTDALYVDDETFQLLVERVTKLETAVDNHPNELTKVRNELRENHIKDMIKLRTEFEQHIITIKEQHKMDIEMLKQRIDLPEARQVAHQKAETNADVWKAVIGEYPAQGIVKTQSHLTNQHKPNKRKSIVGKGTTDVPSAAKRQVGNAGRVAFFAKLSTLTEHVGFNQIIVFDNVTTNIGNHYDRHVGLFRAPHAGIYFFSTTITSQYHSSAHFGIFINDNRETYFYNNGAENGWDETSQTIIVHLNQGDDVTVRSLESDHGVTGNDHSLFSGFLLYSDSEQSSQIIG